MRLSSPVTRTCRRPGCAGTATATLSFRYDAAEVLLLDLVDDPHPTRWDLCAAHADALHVPRGWTCVDERSDAADSDAGDSDAGDAPEAPTDLGGPAHAEDAADPEGTGLRSRHRGPVPGGPGSGPGVAGPPSVAAPPDDGSEGEGDAPADRYAALWAELPALAAAHGTRRGRRDTDGGVDPDEDGTDRGPGGSGGDGADDPAGRGTPTDGGGTAGPPGRPVTSGAGATPSAGGGTGPGSAPGDAPRRRARRGSGSRGQGESARSHAAHTHRTGGTAGGPPGATAADGVSSVAEAGRRFSDLAYESDLWSGAAPVDPIPGQLSMTMPDPESDTVTHEVEVRSNVVPLIRRTAVLDPVH